LVNFVGWDWFRLFHDFEIFELEISVWNPMEIPPGYLT
jgi:hypothetical protein